MEKNNADTPCYAVKDECAAFPGRRRAAVVAGLFYPEERCALEAQIRSFAPGEGAGNAAAIIAPHGAWNISGAIAGAAFSAAAGRARTGAEALSRIVILGCLHDPAGVFPEEGLFLPESSCFETPLGDIPVERKLCRALTSCNTFFQINDIPHLREHTLEVLLPFIKFHFPKAKILPILLGGSRPVLISALARALHIVFKNRLSDTLFVVSANLSKNADAEASRTQAEECIRILEANDAKGFGGGLYDGRLSVCGGGAAAALLQSGLLESKTGRLISGPLLKTRGEGNNTVYYGGISFE
jgi:AmmeMemoRadiSam system protein B